MLTLIAESEEPNAMFHPISSKATVCAFVTPTLVVTGHESGKVALYDCLSGEETAVNERAHSAVVTDLQLSPDRSYFITSSKDKIARVCFLIRERICTSLSFYCHRYMIRGRSMF